MKRDKSQELIKSTHGRDHLQDDEDVKAEDTIFGDHEIEEDVEEEEEEDEVEEEEEEDDETSDEDVVLAGSRPKPITKVNSQPAIAVEDEEESSEEDESEADSQQANIVVPQKDETSTTEDSEDQLIVSPMTTMKQSTSLHLDKKVTVTISSLMFHNNDAGKAILENPAVNALFIEYKFLDVDSAETETPVSLPKSGANQPIYFNFKNGKSLF